MARLSVLSYMLYSLHRRTRLMQCASLFYSRGPRVHGRLYANSMDASLVVAPRVLGISPSHYTIVSHLTSHCPKNYKLCANVLSYIRILGNNRSRFIYHRFRQLTTSQFGEIELALWYGASGFRFHIFRNLRGVDELYPIRLGLLPTMLEFHHATSLFLSVINAATS
jgi:hypothetical protein